MTDEEKIAHHIATRGKTICPPCGWARDQPVIPKVVPGEQFNQRPAGFHAPTSAQRAGAKRANEVRKGRAEARAKAMLHEYERDGWSAVYAIAAREHITALRVREILMHAGAKDLPERRAVVAFDAGRR